MKIELVRFELLNLNQLNDNTDIYAMLPHKANEDFDLSIQLEIRFDQLAFEI